MKINPLILASAAFTLSLAGCGKKEAAPQSVAVDTNATATAQVEAAAPAPETPATLEPIAPTQSAVVDASVKEMDLAVQRRDYEAAAKAMLQLQMSNQRLTEQQGFDQVNRMRQLSKMITDAWARGDTNAARAAELLRKVQAARTMR